MARTQIHVLFRCFIRTFPYLGLSENRLRCSPKSDDLQSCFPSKLRIVKNLGHQCVTHSWTNPRIISWWSRPIRNPVIYLLRQSFVRLEHPRTKCYEVSRAGFPSDHRNATVWMGAKSDAPSRTVRCGFRQPQFRSIKFPFWVLVGSSHLNRVGGLVHPRYKSGRLAPTYPIYNQGYKPLTIRG